MTDPAHQEHPTPWKVGRPTRSDSTPIVDAAGRYIMAIAGPDLATRIVSAVNAAPAPPQPPATPDLPVDEYVYKPDFSWRAYVERMGNPPNIEERYSAYVTGQHSGMAAGQAQAAGKLAEVERFWFAARAECARLGVELEDAESRLATLLPVIEAAKKYAVWMRRDDFDGATIPAPSDALIEAVDTLNSAAEPGAGDGGERG